MRDDITGCKRFHEDARNRAMRYSGGVMTRRNWLAGVPGAVAASAAMQQNRVVSARPNIILIISDQFRADCVGAMGVNPMNLTPNLDSMASRGVLFRSACTN